MVELYAVHVYTTEMEFVKLKWKYGIVFDEICMHVHAKTIEMEYVKLKRNLIVREFYDFYGKYTETHPLIFIGNFGICLPNRYLPSVRTYREFEWQFDICRLLFVCF